MTSQHKIRANRINAKASTGPKTARGRLHAAKNAYRHGLSLSIFANPARSAEVEDLALEIAGAGATSDVVELARRVAEAQIDLVRVRKARRDFLSGELNDPKYRRPLKYLRDVMELVKFFDTFPRQRPDDVVLPPGVEQYAEHVIHWKPEGAEKLKWILSEHSHQLIAMDRYERRALSRRKFAIRALDLARQQGTKP
jgi:hypothetical protein